MTKSLKIIVASFVLCVGLNSFMSNKAAAQMGASISFQAFYDELSPYGIWLDDPTYGYVWSPDVGQDFHPYGSNGHWMVTDYGNTWVSDYNWGWAPFHYGRWKYDDYNGWIWIPGYEWGPAWVSWRSGGGYYGWAPLSPGISIGVSIRLPLRHWVFVPQRYIVYRNIFDYCVPYRRRGGIYHHTTIINNIYVRNHNRYVYGPSIRHIERVTHRRVNVYNVNNSYRPSRSVVGGETVNMYRPSVSRKTSNKARPRPKYASSSTRPRGSDGNTARVRPNSNSRPNVDASRPRTQTRPSVNNGSRRPVGESSRVRPSSRPQVRQQPQTRPSSRPTQSRPSVRPSSRTSARPQVNRPTSRPSVKRESRPAVRPSAKQHSRSQVKRNAPSPRVQRESRPAVKQSRPQARPQSRPAPQRVSRPSSRQTPKASAHSGSSRSSKGKTARSRPRPRS